MLEADRSAGGLTPDRHENVRYQSASEMLAASCESLALELSCGGFAGHRFDAESAWRICTSSETAQFMPVTGGPGNGQSFDYAAGPVPQLDTVQLDTHHGGCEFLDAEAQLVKYRTVLDRMESCALESAESGKIIEHLIQNL